MKQLLPTLLVFVTLIIVLSSAKAQERKVLIIGIDGVRADVLQTTNTPNIDGLLDSSLYTFDAWHVGITFSGPTWSSILTGVEWNKHGVKDANDFSGSNFQQYPPFPTLAKQILPDLNCAMVAEWGPLIDDIDNHGFDTRVRVADGMASATADSAIILLADTTLDAMFVYFDTVDITGHAGGFNASNSNYVTAIERADAAVGRVLDALYARPSYANEDWLILVTTDHGGNGIFGHGLNTDDERQMWFIANGTAVEHKRIGQMGDPNTYNCRFNSTLQYSYDATCVDTTLMRMSPIYTDVAVTALHHLLYNEGIDFKRGNNWDLDGRSYLIPPVDTSVGIRNQHLAVQSVYPNPTNGLVSIGLNGNIPSAQVLVYDLLGRSIDVSVNQASNNRIELDLAGKPMGTYVIKMIAEEKVLTAKVILSGL